MKDVPIRLLSNGIYDCSSSIPNHDLLQGLLNFSFQDSHIILSFSYSLRFYLFLSSCIILDYVILNIAIINIFANHDIWSLDPSEFCKVCSSRLSLEDKRFHFCSMPFGSLLNVNYVTIYSFSTKFTWFFSLHRNNEIYWWDT